MYRVICFVLGFCCTFGLIQTVRMIALHDVPGTGVMAFLTSFSGTVLVLMFLDSRKKRAKTDESVR